MARVRPASVVIVDESGDAVASVSHGVVGFQVKVLIPDRGPEAFDEDVGAPRPATIHAELTTLGAHGVDIVFTSELTALIGVHDFRIKDKCRRPCPAHQPHGMP